MASDYEIYVKRDFLDGHFGINRTLVLVRTPPLEFRYMSSVFNGDRAYITLGEEFDKFMNKQFDAGNFEYYYAESLKAKGAVMNLASTPMRDNLIPSEEIAFKLNNALSLCAH